MGRLQSFFVHSLAVANMITMQRTSSAPKARGEGRTENNFLHTRREDCDRWLETVPYYAQ